MPRFSFFLRLPVLLFLVHVYVASRLAFGYSDAGARWAVIALLTTSYLVLMAGFLARNQVGDRLPDIISWVGFIALGLFSWLFVLTVVRDAVLVVLIVIQWVSPWDHTPWMTSLVPASVSALIIISVLACVIGLIQARRRPPVIPVDIVIPGLPDALDGFRIVQITDLHVGPTIKRGFVQRVVDVCNRLNADVIVLTGDLVDGSVERLAPHVEPLSALTSRHGTFAVTGNHEYYVGALPWIAQFRHMGITVLLNEHRVLEHDGETLLLAGVTDFGAEKFDVSQASDPAAALLHAPEDASAKILLAHQPRSAFAAAPLGFDLQLSGHTHGGQFWPWAHFVPLQQPFVAGLHLYQGMMIYVSRGTGYWGPPLRLGAPSEITLIELRSKQ